MRYLFILLKPENLTIIFMNVKNHSNVFSKHEFLKKLDKRKRLSFVSSNLFHKLNFKLAVFLLKKLEVPIIR